MKNNSAGAAHLFFMPSFYGAATWVVALVLYHMRFIAWNVPCIETRALCWMTAVVLVVATVLMSSSFKTAVGSMPPAQARTDSLGHQVVLLHAIGFVGLAKYCSDAAAYLGGPAQFLFTIMYKSHEVRWANQEIGSLGTQLSYFGWAAIAFTAYGIAGKRLSRWWAVLAFVQFAGNILFIDRTRPIWITFTAALVVMAARPPRSFAFLAKAGSMLLVFFVAVFLVIAAWVGKVGEEGKYGASALPPAAQNVYYYVTSGYPYLDAIIKREEPSDYLPTRSLFPLFKVLSHFDLAKAPPNRVNDFYEVPFATNVGTFLEPLYRDGGVAYCLLGVVGLGFGCNLLALWLLRSGDLWCIYLWSHLCFTAFIAFFTPKHCTTSMWIFAAMAPLSLLLRRGNYESSVSDKVS